MSNKHFLKKSLVIGIIILFIGTSIFPSISGKNKQIKGIFNEHPIVKITNPNDGEMVQGIIEISGTSNDSDGTVELVEVRIEEDGEWEESAGTTNWTIEWDTTTVFDGWHTIFARCYDGELYSQYDIIGVIVDNDPNNDPPNKPETPDGPSILGRFENGIYNTSTIDPDGDQLFYLFFWDDGTNNFWKGPYESGCNFSEPHSWDKVGYYDVKSQALDQHGAKSEWSDPLTVEVILGKNKPPRISRINGPSSGLPRKSYTYNFIAIDPEGYKVYYQIDWGDFIISPWLGPYNSNFVLTRSHIWFFGGYYAIKARAKDINGSIGDWSKYDISMPRNSALSCNFLKQLFEQFPNLFQKIQLLIQDINLL